MDLKELLYNALHNRKKVPMYTHAEYEEAYRENPLAFIRATMAMCAYSKCGVRYLTCEGMNTVNVKGLRNLVEGLPMLMAIARSNKRVFYINMDRLCILFGGWKTLTLLWEYDLMQTDMDTGKCILDPLSMMKLLRKGIYDPMQGPDAVKALPIIRKDGESRTIHRKAWNFIGKYLRSKLTKGSKACNRDYRKLKKRYKGKRMQYNRLDPSYLFSLDKDALYEELTGQEAMKLLYDGQTTKGKYRFYNTKFKNNNHYGKAKTNSRGHEKSPLFSKNTR